MILLCRMLPDLLFTIALCMIITFKYEYDLLVLEFVHPNMTPRIQFIVMDTF